MMKRYFSAIVLAILTVSLSACLVVPEDGYHRDGRWGDHHDGRDGGDRWPHGH